MNDDEEDAFFYYVFQSSSHRSSRRPLLARISGEATSNHTQREERWILRVFVKRKSHARYTILGRIGLRVGRN